METTILYTQGEWSIDYDPSVPCMTGRFEGFQTTEEAKGFMNKGLELMIKKEPTGKIGWISDIRKADAAEDEFLRWCVEVYNICALEAGIRHIAFILPEDEYALATMSVEMYQEKRKLISRNFKNPESAKAWLKGILNGE